MSGGAESPLLPVRPLTRRPHTAAAEGLATADALSLHGPNVPSYVLRNERFRDQIATLLSILAAEQKAAQPEDTTSINEDNIVASQRVPRPLGALLRIELANSFIRQ